MADEAPETFGAGFWNYLTALGFISPLLGGEELIRSQLSTGPTFPLWLNLTLIAVGLPLYQSKAIWKKLHRRKPAADKPNRLEYLHNRDTDLSSAIVSAAWLSAYGRWLASQQLVNSGQPINPRYLLHRMAGEVIDKITDGDIEIRGRKPGQMHYEPIPRTYWRSSSFLVMEDAHTLWRIVLAPRGGVEIGPDGNIARSDDADATARTAQLRDYDSLLVDAYQFEKIWPRKDDVADKERRQFLRQARKRKLNADEIRRLS